MGQRANQDELTLYAHLQHGEGFWSLALLPNGELPTVNMQVTVSSILPAVTDLFFQQLLTGEMSRPFSTTFFNGVWGPVHDEGRSNDDSFATHRP